MEGKIKVLDLNEVYMGDCLDWMELIDDKSIDMILCDLPYGVTGNKWDAIIPLEQMWKHYHRIIKPNGAIVLHCIQPFTSMLMLSNSKHYRHGWVWNKNNSAGFATAKIRPLTICEDILVFGLGKVTYYPIMVKGKARWKGGYSKSSNYGLKPTKSWSDEYYPKNLLEFSNASQKGKKHPTQKPVPLAEYFIKTYTQPGELVLDNCAGSGTTAIACLNTNRDFILIEKEPKYVEICEQRIAQWREQTND